MRKIIDYNAAVVPGGNFKWQEIALLREWNCLLVPTMKEQANATFLFEKLQPLRELLGRPLVVTSGARSIQYTQYLRSKGIPAATRSAHLEWQALDLQCPSMSTAELWRFFNKHWLGRMENISATPTWVHIDTRNWGQRIRFNP